MIWVMVPAVSWPHSSANKVQFFCVTISIQSFLEIFKTRKFGMGFSWGLIFGPGIFLGFVGSPWDFFGF